MKQGAPYKVTHGQGGGDNADITVDYAETPDNVMLKVNEALARFGLEFISHETESDFGAYSIQKIN